MLADKLGNCSVASSRGLSLRNCGLRDTLELYSDMTHFYTEAGTKRITSQDMTLGVNSFNRLDYFRCKV